MLIPIVGLQHFVPDPSQFVAALPEGEEIVLVPDTGNMRDRTAIAAYHQGSRVGYVSSDFTEWIHVNYPDFISLVVLVCQDKFSFDPEIFFVSVDVEILEISPAPLRINFDPIHDIPLPQTCVAHRLAMEDVERRCLDLKDEYFDGVSVNEQVVDSLMDVARCMAKVYGSSLSGDDRRIYCLVEGLMYSALTYLTSNMTDLYLEMLTLQDIRAGFTQDDGQTAAAIMQAEIAGIREECAAFMDEYHRLIESGLVTREDLQSENDAWLRALPDNLYAHLDHPEELALRLFYERFTTSELNTIYLHLILRAEALSSGPSLGPSAARRDAVPAKARVRFSYWCTHPAPTAVEKREARRDLLDAARADKQPGLRLSKVIAHLQRQHVLQEDLAPVTQFCRNLAAWLNIPNPYNSLKRYL